MVYANISSKPKKRTVALKDKMDILEEFDSGENMFKFAKEFGVERATLHKF